MLAELTLATACGAAGMAWAVRGKSASVFGRSIWRGPLDSFAVALTFDDGPSESTPRLLEVLARHHASATFFQCGANVRRLPEIARAVAKAGHEIGNHTDTHPIFCFRSAAFMRDEIERAQASIVETTGRTPRLLRAPFGVRWPGLGEAQQATGLTGVMWTVIGRDWKLAAPQIARRLCRVAAGGAILCLHDGREIRPNPNIEPTIEAVRRLVPELLERGYQLKTVSHLCQTT